jgi:hypothetical protein
MSTKKNPFAFAALAAAALMVAISSAKAEPWPSSVVGTWDVHANQSHLTMVIKTQTPGQNTDCNQIEGTIWNVGAAPPYDTISGFYCLYSGKISFRRTGPAGPTFQTWTGNLSDPGIVFVLIGGTFVSYSSNLGEYGFYATKANVR